MEQQQRRDTLTVKEVARLTGVSYAKALECTRRTDGLRLPTVRVGKRLAVERDAVPGWMERVSDALVSDTW